MHTGVWSRRPARRARTGPQSPCVVARDSGRNDRLKTPVVCRRHLIALSQDLTGVPFCHSCRREQAIEWRQGRGGMESLRLERALTEDSEQRAEAR